MTVTDGNGCIDSDEVILFEPEEFSISFIVSQPDYFDHQDECITVEQSGGIETLGGRGTSTDSPGSHKLLSNIYSMMEFRNIDFKFKLKITAKEQIMVKKRIPISRTRTSPLVTELRCTERANEDVR